MLRISTCLSRMEFLVTQSPRTHVAIVCVRACIGTTEMKDTHATRISAKHRCGSILAIGHESTPRRNRRIIVFFLFLFLLSSFLDVTFAWTTLPDSVSSFAAFDVCIRLIACCEKRRFRVKQRVNYDAEDDTRRVI